MPKRSWNLNTVYISERLQECLRPISRCALTTVVAPMGYGKTTAVNWYLLERAKLDEAAVVRISVYSDNLAIFWKSVQEAFSHAGFDFLRAYPCPDDAAGGSLLTDDLCHALAGKRPCYIFIDDFHLLTDNRVPAFLCTLTNRLPENVHLIVASRDRFLPAEEILRLGGRLYTVGAEQLRLNHTELSIYAHRCGTELSDAQIESLLYSSEGWFSAIYLNLRTLHERGELPSRSSDIYAMFSAAMIDPLPSKRREFLAVMGLADEFTVEMAETVTGSKNTAAILQTLTEQNAFVKRLPDGVTFRFHHMMKDCAERTFHTMEPRRQAVYHNRYGEWYKTHGQYLHALKFYCLAKNYDAALRVIQRDAGILLTSLGAQQVLDFIAHCPVETLKEHPLSLLVLMRSMFTWRQIPKMLELKELLLAAITEHPDWPESERGDLLGECDLIMSFLMYNDISAMSRLHRSASAQMSRPAISIQKSGGWTFGSPSVLMMFYRASGELQSELTEMDECMPHYYKITNGHGQGAETIMRAEADFMRACFADAQIMLERADATPHEKRELAALAEHPEQLIARVKDWADLNRRTADITPYRALVHQYLDEARFFASPVDFGLMTARFPSFQPVEVRKQDIAPGYLPQWILASSACYPMFPMCEIDGQNYLDGAYSDNLPIGTAFRLGADRVIAIGLKPETPEKKYANHPLVTYIAPAEPLGKLLEFDPDALRHSIALGYTDTLRVLGSYIGHTYTFEPDGQTLLEGVARDYLLWLLRRELTPPDSMLDFFRSDTPLTDRVLSDQHSDLTACALAGAECVLEAYAYPRGEIYDLKLLLPELAMRLAEDEDTPALERAHALCASLGSEHFFTQLAPLTPRYDARDIFLATLTLYLREQTA